MKVSNGSLFFQSKSQNPHNDYKGPNDQFLHFGNSGLLIAIHCAPSTLQKLLCLNLILNVMEFGFQAFGISQVGQKSKALMNTITFL